MISIANITHKKAATLFYKTIKDEVVNRIEDKKAIINIASVNGKTLSSYLNNNIKNLLIGNLRSTFNTHEKILKDTFDKYYYVKDKKSSDFKKGIDHILFYEDHGRWKAYEIIKMLDIHCCPYCNRTYITTLGDDTNKFARADFDHFLAKSTHPYLRFNFYNLIPSCVICNRNAKWKNETKLDENIYPYEEGFDNDAKFTFIPSSYDALKKGFGSKIQIIPKDPNSIKGKKIQNNIELFRLNQQYSIHHRELHSILQKKEKHPTSYVCEIIKAFPNLFKNEKEVYEYIFGKPFKENEFLQFPLAKFFKDIHEEIR